MTTPRGRWFALGRRSRRIRGLALLAAGPSVLAACTTGSTRVLYEPACPPLGAPATVRSDETSSVLLSPATDVSRAETAPCAIAMDDAVRIVGRPPPPTLRECQVDACVPAPLPPWQETRKSYGVVAGDIVGFEFLLNQYDRHVVSYETFGTNGESIVRNLSRSWVFDKDPFATNQFQHPYGGSIYHGFARSAGFDYWESLAWVFGASALWEIAGETDPPSLNDQITTTFAGSFLGEALFRAASLILERGGDCPGTLREVEAALVAPSAAFNRHVYGSCFRAVFPSRDPAVFGWWGVGARRNTALTDVGVLSNLQRDVAVALVSLDYGLPGKSGYRYDRPFDYFHFEVSGTSSEHALPENIVVRGLLVGTDYGSGRPLRGIWGLYGSYDYFSPEVFKVSSTALSLGTTWQYLVSDRLALQGSLLGGVGFTMSGTTADTSADRTYRYSASPQALVAFRAVYRDIAMLDVTANDYLLANDLASSGTSGSENILRAQVSLIVRIFGRHAIGLQFVESSRHPSFSGAIGADQSVGALSLFYTFLGDTNFGVVRP